MLVATFQTTTDIMYDICLELKKSFAFCPQSVGHFYVRYDSQNKHHLPVRLCSDVEFFTYLDIIPASKC